jgi:hypothetical protein
MKKVSNLLVDHSLKNLRSDRLFPLGLPPRFHASTFELRMVSWTIRIIPHAKLNPWGFISRRAALIASSAYFEVVDVDHGRIVHQGLGGERQGCALRVGAS